MTAPQRTKTKGFFRLAIIAGLVATVSGCKTADLAFITDGFAGNPIPLPTYAVGDTFNYINDRKEPVLRQVVRLQGDMVEWKTETPYRFLSFRSFFLPRVSWDGELSSGVSTAVPDSNVMWPLKPGKEAKVTSAFRRTDKTKKVSLDYKQTWECKSYKRQEITVPAGTFDTIKVICRYIAKSGKRSRRMRIWYFAPKIGHFVKRVRKYRHKPDMSWELVSVSKVPRR